MVVFVSRRNTLRSVLAEACLTHLGAKRFIAFSCGDPSLLKKEIHPAAVGALASASIPLVQHPRRGWDELTRPGAPKADFVITLDEAMVAKQPRWPGQPDTALWALPDAAAIVDPEEAAHASIQILHSLRRRLELLISLPLHGSDRSAIRSDLRDMAHMR